MSIPTAALWIGTYPTAGDAPGTGEGIWRVDIDPSGRFAGGELVVQAASPSFLALDPSGRTLLAVTEREPGRLTSFRVSDAGELSPASAAASGGSGPCHVVATATVAWVANYTDGVAAAVPLADDGGLRAPRTFSHAGSGPVADRQEGPHAHFTHVWGDRVLVSDLGTDELRTYPLDAGEEVGTTTVAAVLPPGTGPRHLVELADGTILVAGELDCRLHVLVPAGPGRLEHVGSVAITGRTMPDGAAGYPSHISVAGDLVHVGVRGPDVLSVLRVREAPAGADGPGVVGHLVVENVSDVDLGAGAWPRHHAVLADGAVVVVAAQNTDELIAVRLDRASGAGEVVDRLELPVPACVLEA
ncbi:lactonase family protein [Promicromonospora panici]|uniref:lactonase family protein n=1 Tax=Promicromonospora panici TaxID=2219658 RepID=UPI00101CE24E|nr:beta-propeller fold lactonase family protein [Promicromonospora panici]